MSVRIGIIHSQRTAATPDFRPFEKGMLPLLGEERVRRMKPHFECLASMVNDAGEELLFYRHSETGRYLAFDAWGRVYEYMPARGVFERGSLREVIREMPELAVA